VTLRHCTTFFFLWNYSLQEPLFSVFININFPCKKCNKKDWHQNARQLEFFFFFNPVIMVRTGLGDWLLLPLVSLKKNYTKPRLLLLSSLLSFSGAWPLDTCLFFSFLFFSFVPKSTPPLLFFFLSWNAFTIYVEKYCVFHSHIYMKRLYSCWGLDFKYFFK
jgi:hypothetical protein